MSPALARWSFLVGALVLGVPGVAAAGSWYYNWSCTGECAPGQLAISGREGPFASREDCDYARDHDANAQWFVAPGNLGGLDFCYEQASPPTAGAVPAAAAPPNKVRMQAIEVGLAVGPGWLATGENAMATRGAVSLGLEVDAHSGREVGGGAIQIGLHGTQLEAPLLGAEPRTLLVVPFFVGLVLTPKVAGGATWSVRADLGGSVGGLWKVGCSECAGAVFDEPLTFGYTLKAGLDVYLSKDNGVSVDALFPRWPMGAAGVGNLLLEPPTWMLRLALIGRPAPN